MDHKELTSKILEESGAEARDQIQEEKRSKFILFRIAEALYALPAEDVQEVMLDLVIHHLPFLPPFVRGLVNRLGEPITVVDLEGLFHQQLLNAKTFLILKPRVSKMAFLIDEVHDIVRLEDSAVGKLSAATGNLNDYGLGMIAYKGKEIFLLNGQAVVQTVKEAVRGQFLVLSYAEADFLLPREDIVASTSRSVSEGRVQYGNRSLWELDLDRLLRNPFPYLSVQKTRLSLICRTETIFPTGLPNPSPADDLFALAVGSESSVAVYQYSEFRLLPFLLRKSLGDRGLAATRFASGDRIQYLLDLNVFLASEIVPVAS